MSGHQTLQGVKARLGGAAEADPVEVPVQVQGHMAILARVRPDRLRQPSLTHARAAPGAAVAGDRLVVAGQPDKQLVAQAEALDFR